MGRFDGAQLVQLKGFCDSHDWRPVYLDETSAVLVRRTPQTEALIQRFPVDCATAPLPNTPLSYSSAASFNQWANAANLLALLGRNTEALLATDSALQAFPDSPFVHWLRGHIFSSMNSRSDAEQEYLTAISLEPSEVVWTALANLYQREGRIPETIHAWQQASKLSSRPDVALIRLAQFYLRIQQPKLTLQTLDDALRSASADAVAATGDGCVRFNVAEGRAAAWRTLGDLKQATSFQEQAVQLAPESADAWSTLAKLYERQGRFDDEYRAEARAAKLGEHPGSMMTNEIDSPRWLFLVALSAQHRSLPSRNDDRYVE